MYCARRVALAGICTALLSACRSSSPAGPSASAKVWKLSGIVKAASNGVGLFGARVMILDGPAAYQSVTADANGAYTFAALAQGGMSVQAFAPGYSSQIIGVTLTRDTVQDFALARILAANVQLVPGNVTPQLQPDGDVAVHHFGGESGRWVRRQCLRLGDLCGRQYHADRDVRLESAGQYHRTSGCAVLLRRDALETGRVVAALVLGELSVRDGRLSVA